MSEIKLKKNKRKITTMLPKTSYFTISDVCNLNNESKPITVRVHLTEYEMEGKIVPIGNIHGGMGAPPKVYAHVPVTEITLAKAKANNITINYNPDKLVNVATVMPKAKVPSMNYVAIKR